MAENTTAAMTTTNYLSKGSTVNNEESADHDATNDEENILDPIRIEGGLEERADTEATPNTDFCFTKDVFLESITEINDATRHLVVWHKTWKKFNELEGEEIVCQKSERR